MATQQQIDAIVDPIVAAGITGEALAVFLSRGQTQMEITAIDSKLRNLEAERAKAQAEFDRVRNELQDLRAAKQAELDAQGG